MNPRQKLQQPTCQPPDPLPNLTTPMLAPTPGPTITKFQLFLVSLWCFLSSFISIYFFCTILSLTDYLYKSFYTGIEKDYTKSYFIGSFISFLLFNHLSKILKFNTRLIIILLSIFATMSGIWILAQVSVEIFPSKNGIFLLLVFLVGFVEVHLQNSFLIKGNLLGKRYVILILIGMAVASVTPNVLILGCMVWGGAGDLGLQADVVMGLGFGMYGVWILVHFWVVGQKGIDLGRNLDEQ